MTVEDSLVLDDLFTVTILPNKRLKINSCRLFSHIKVENIKSLDNTKNNDWDNFKTSKYRKLLLVRSKIQYSK